MKLYRSIVYAKNDLENYLTTKRLELSGLTTETQRFWKFGKKLNSIDPRPQIARNSK